MAYCFCKLELDSSLSSSMCIISVKSAWGTNEGYHRKIAETHRDRQSSANRNRISYIIRIVYDFHNYYQHVLHVHGVSG